MQQTSPVQRQFPPDILKNLLDKNQQKKNLACKQIEQSVKKIINKQKPQKNDQIDKIIQNCKKYTIQKDYNKKKSGLLALNSIAIGIQCNASALKIYLQPIVMIIIQCLLDQQNKARYAALKSLYYLCKQLQQKILIVFNKIFDSLISRIIDLDQQTRNAAQFLDSALQTLLNTSMLNAQNKNLFNIKQFMDILLKKLKSNNSTIKIFLIRWINVLNQIVTINIFIYLPDILQNLLSILQQKCKQQLKTNIIQCLNNFKKQMQDKFNQNKLDNYLNIQLITKILHILINVAKNKSNTQSKKFALSFIQLHIRFFKQQLQPKSKILPNKFLFKKVILDRFDQVLQPILLLMSCQQQVGKLPTQANKILIQAIQMVHRQQTINFSKVMPLLKTIFSQKKSTSTSQHALKWIKFMLQNYNDKMLPQINQILSKLVQKLCDHSLQNVTQIIKNTTVTQQYFESLIQKMLMLLSNKTQTADKPQQILKKFSSILQPNKFCKSLAIQLSSQNNNSYDNQYIYQIVQHLIHLIITQKSMLKVRKKLQNKQDPQFFNTLFKAFKYNPAALTSLCFLCQQYQFAYKLIQTITNKLKITQLILNGFCKLVALIQSPGFLSFRFEMLNRKKYPHLIQCLCSILMILPQGNISTILKNRLDISKIIIDCSINPQLQQNKNKQDYNIDKFEYNKNNKYNHSIIQQKNKLMDQFIQCQLKFDNGNK